LALRHETAPTDSQADHFAHFNRVSLTIGAIAIHGLAADGLIGKGRCGQRHAEGQNAERFHIVIIPQA